MNSTGSDFLPLHNPTIKPRHGGMITRLVGIFLSLSPVVGNSALPRWTLGAAAVEAHHHTDTRGAPHRAQQHPAGAAVCARAARGCLRVGWGGAGCRLCGQDERGATSRSPCGLVKGSDFEAARLTGRARGRVRQSLGVAGVVCGGVMGTVLEGRVIGGGGLRLVLVCVLLAAKRTGVESAVSEFSTCVVRRRPLSRACLAYPRLVPAHRTSLPLSSCPFLSCDRSNGLCNCKEADQRCEAIKEFFEHSHEGCASGGGMSTCVHPDYLGYQSCAFARRISECRVSVCWAWTVSVMATCGSFFTDMQSSPLSVCNASLTGPNTGAYTFATHQQQRIDAEEGRAVDAPACTASHGQCTEHCATQFLQLWRDPECSTWLQNYVSMPLARSQG